MTTRTCTRTLGTAAVALFVALGGAACGGDDPVTDPTEPSSSASAGAESPPPGTSPTGASGSEASADGPLVAARMQVPSSPGDLRIIVTSISGDSAQGIVQLEETGESVDLDLTIAETTEAFDHTLELVRVSDETAVFRVTAPDGTLLGP